MGTKNDRNTSGVYRAEALRLIQSRRNMDTLWDSVAVSDDSGNRDLSGSWSRPGNHKRILAADCDTDIT